MTASAAQAPLIGREAELERLRTALSSMLDVGGNALVLSGEAGIGKTRLIQEFAADALSRERAFSLAAVTRPSRHCR